MPQAVVLSRTQEPTSPQAKPTALKSLVSSRSKSQSPAKNRSRAKCISESGRHPASAVQAIESGRGILAERQLNELSPMLPTPVPKSPKKQRLDWWRSSKDKQQPRLDHESITMRKEENTTPPESADVETPARTPIWAQFATQLSVPADKANDVSPQTAVCERPARAMSITKDSVAQDDTSSSKKMSPAADHGPKQQSGHVRSKTAPGNIPQLSRVAVAVSLFNGRSQKGPENNQTPARPSIGLDDHLESVMAAQNIPEKARERMRMVDRNIKKEFVKNAKSEATIEQELLEIERSRASSRSRSRFTAFGRARSKSRVEEEADGKVKEDLLSTTKRSRSRGRAFTFGKTDGSPSKRSRSQSRPRSLMSLKNFSSSSVNSMGYDGSKDSKEQGIAPLMPSDFVIYMKEPRNIQDVEVGKMHKLRLLLRNESISWVDSFVEAGGMVEILSLFKKITLVEWREEHEDMLLHQLLLCLKALSITQKALDSISQIEASFFGDMLHMLFDKEKKGPSEFNTREIVITIMFNYLAAARYGGLSRRARSLLSYLEDPETPEDKRPIGFVAQMQRRRPYQLWCKEISNVTKEVFWIFLHHHNTIPHKDVSEQSNQDLPYSKRHFPQERPPVPAAPYVGGPEWDATNYIATHLDLMNGLIVSLESKQERNALRDELRSSGMERVMSDSLRLCKEKFYTAVHDGLVTWVAAAAEDGWDVLDVRTGSSAAETQRLPKLAKENTHKLELPVLSFDNDKGAHSDKENEEWI